MLCGWHIQKNLVSRFSKLKSLDKDLYNKILSLPFITSEEKFNAIVEEVMDSEIIPKNQLDYLKLKLNLKNLWAKCLLKDKFLGGISTTSRIEGLHAKQKAYLTSQIGLQRLFHGFRVIEKTQISNFKEEYFRHQNESRVENINSLKELQDKFPEYIYLKMNSKFCKGLNYKHEKFGNNLWLIIFFSIH